jgi:AcrR family transcriptional regulator
MAKKPDISQKLIDAAFDLAVTEKWRFLSMSDIARHANVALPDALNTFRNKSALLNAVMDTVDRAALNECSKFQSDDSTKDKLFALLMARFDALAPHRTAFGAIVCDSLRSPFVIPCRLPRIMKSMALMLEAAGIASNGSVGVLRTNGLALVFAGALCAWLRDESDDMAATMSALDKGLCRADGIARRVPCF